jgi:hypothetical protein
MFLKFYINNSNIPRDEINTTRLIVSRSLNWTIWVRFITRQNVFSFTSIVLSILQNTVSKQFFSPYRSITVSLFHSQWSKSLNDLNTSETMQEQLVRYQYVAIEVSGETRISDILNPIAAPLVIVVRND